MLSYSVIGMGAVGGYYGGRLAQAANALGVKSLTADFADKMMQMTDEMVPYSP